MGISRKCKKFVSTVLMFSCCVSFIGCGRANVLEQSESYEIMTEQRSIEETEGVILIKPEVEKDKEEMFEIFSCEKLYGTWKIDSAVLISDIYTGTTKDGVLAEDLYNPDDYKGFELEYAETYFRLGEETYKNPLYSVEVRSIEDIGYYDGHFRNPTLEGFIMEQQIKVYNETDCPWLALVELPTFRVEFDDKVSYEQYDFIPMGRVVTLLNDDTMLVGDWGRVVIAYRVCSRENNKNCDISSSDN